MKNTKVYFDWEPDKRLKDYLIRELEQTEAVLYFKDDITESEKLKILPAIDVLVGWRPSYELLDKAAELSVIINPGAGVQHLKPLAPILNERNITLINDHGNSYFTAQHGVALLLSLMNKVTPHHNAMVSGKWRLGDNYAASIPLRGKKIGLLGYGHVNKKVHQFLSGFDVSFSVLRRNDDAKVKDIINYGRHFKDKFFKDNDIIIIAVPLTKKTKYFVGAKELGYLGKNGLIVNIGRGEVIVEKELYESLKNDIIAGAAVDVWYDYRPEEDPTGKKYPFNFPFHKLNNLILSPHRAASPFDDLKRWDEVVENISRICKKDNELMNIVDIAEGY